MTQRYRYSSAITVAAAIAFVAAMPVALAGWYFLPVLLIPAAVALWSWRAGTDLDQDRLTLRAAFGSRRVPWTSVDSVAADPKGRVLARLTNGNVVRLPAVTSKDLAQILETLSNPR